MRYVSILALVSLVACRSIPTQPDPATLGDAPACKSVYDDALAEIEWRRPVVTATQAGGIILGVAGPAIAVLGIAADDQPATPPVEAFVVAGAVTAAGVTSFVIGGVIADGADAHAIRARNAYANPCG